MLTDKPQMFALKFMKKVILSPICWMFLGASLWIMFWAYIVYHIFFSTAGIQAFGILAIYSLPSFYISNLVSDFVESLVTHEYITFIHLSGVLVFGSLQYGFIGYLFGKFLKWAYIRSWPKK